jgi:cation diffusion facilitator family transporter
MSGGEERLRQGRGITLAGMVVNLVLVVVKLAVGWWGHSAALVADAVHSLSDLATDGLTLLGLRLGSVPADHDHQWGHGRVETLFAALVGLGLMGTGLLLAASALHDLLGAEHLPPTWPAAVVAGISLVVKEVLYRRTMAVGRRMASKVVEANAWHHRSDALSSLAVLVGVGAAVIHPAWHFLDALAALVVVGFVLWAGGEVLWSAVRELSDAAPEASIQRAIMRCARGVEGVRDVHDLRVRLAGGRYHMELHVEVDASLSVLQGHAIAKEVEGCLRREIPRVERVIIHVDPHQH